MSTKKQWYESLFDNYGEQYDSECFAQGTIGECDFIETELAYNKQLKILDVGCGTGRHSIELSKRGYNVTGIDLSDNLLEKARKKAKERNLEIKFLQHDARELPFNNEFDFAIMICEGAFPLMETDEMNYQILQNISKSLKDKSKLILTTLNGLFPLYNSINEFHDADSSETGARYKSKNFDLMSFRDYNTTSYTDDDGVEHHLECNERYYIPPEMTWLLKSVGFTKIDIYGAKLGAFSRNDVLTDKDFEMLVIAER